MSELDNQSVEPIPNSYQNPPPPTPSELPPAAPKNNKSLLVAGACIALVLVGAGGYYFGAKNNSTTSQTELTTVVTPTVEPSPVPQDTPNNTSLLEETKKVDTTNWKTFFEPNVAYTFKYPDNAKLLIDTAIQVSYQGEKQGSGNLTDGYIVSFNLPGPSTREEFEQHVKLETNIYDKDTADLKVNPIKVKEYTGYQFYYSHPTERMYEGQTSSYIFLYSEKTNVIVTLRTVVNDPDNNKYQEIIDKILNSLEIGVIPNTEN